MKTNFLKLTFLILIGAISAEAQVQKQLIGKYSSYVLSDLHTVSKKLELSLDRQFAIATFLRTQDSLATVKLLNGASVEEVQSYYDLTYKNLKDVLTVSESVDYVLSDLNKSSTNYLLLKNRVQLTLTENQITSLLKIDLQDSSVQRLSLNSILDNKQLEILANMSRDNRARLNAANNFAAIRKAGIVVADSVKTLDDLYKFEKLKIDELDKATLTNDISKIKEARIKINSHRPLAILRLEMENNKLSDSKMSQALGYRDILQLSPRQIDMMLLKAVEIDNLSAQPSTKIPLETLRLHMGLEAVKKILTRDQCDKFMVLRFSGRAKVKVDSYLAELKQYKLLNEKDVEEVRAAIFDYQVQLMIIDDAIKYDRSESNIGKRMEIIDAKPEILNSLASAKSERQF